MPKRKLRKLIWPDVLAPLVKVERPQWAGGLFRCDHYVFSASVEGAVGFLIRKKFMARPTPVPIEPANLLELALAVIRADRFPYLATIDGDQPRLRPVSPVRTEGFVIYIANLASYHKTIEIQANPKVELCYLDSGHDQVRITGVAAVENDQRCLQEIWDTNPLLQQYLGTLDNPALIVYRITPVRVRFMREWALEYHEVPFQAVTTGD